jgi:hypothetical protein
VLLPNACRGPIGKSLGKRRESILSPEINREVEGAFAFATKKTNLNVVQIMSHNTINDAGQLDIIELSPSELMFDIHELQNEDLALVSAGLDPTTGGSMLVGMALIPGINVGVAAFALTTGLGFILGNAWYGGGGSWFKSMQGQVQMQMK